MRLPRPLTGPRRKTRVGRSLQVDRTPLTEGTPDFRGRTIRAQTDLRRLGPGPWSTATRVPEEDREVVGGIYNRHNENRYFLPPGLSNNDNLDKYNICLLI